VKVSVIGLGYIGLPTATMFASKRTPVVGVDVSQHVVDTINRGEIHIVEPDLDTLVKEVVSNGWLKASLKPEPADAFLIAVPTPFKGDHEPDLAYVESAARAVAEVLEPGNIVILESTSPVGTTEKMVGWISLARPDLRIAGKHEGEVDIHVAYCPERVLPGKVIQELVNNDRTVGGITPECARRACDVYRIFVEGELVVSDARTAEMCKLTENAFRDVNIAFANELSLICDRLGINVLKLIELSNRHPRVNILRPGCGVGGHCIAVDPWFIVDKTPELARMVRTAREVNDGKPKWVVEKIDQALARCEASGKKRVAVLGLAFKPDIDDLRESPALHIASELASREDIELLVVEPNIQALPPALQSAKLTDLETIKTDADAVVILVAHKQFIEAKDALRTCGNLIDTAGVCNG